MRSLLLASLCVLSACPKSGTPSSKGPGPDDSFIVAGEEGVQEIGVDGTMRRSLTSHPDASRPRLTPDGKSVIFLSKGHIWEVPRAGGEPRDVAEIKLPTKEDCTFEEPEEGATDYVQDDYSFWLSPDGKRACVQLQDRNINMASLIYLSAVDLATGKTESVYTLGEECGEVDFDEAMKQLACPFPTGDKAKPPASAYRLDEGKLIGPNGVVKMELGEDIISGEEISPSGRWQVVGMHQEEGDYIYRMLVILDRKEGTFHPVKESRTWPKALTDEDLEDDQVLGELTMTGTGEQNVKWYPGDRLVLGSYLVVPGERIVEAGGDVAF
jgi:hypothetical protein